MAEFKKKFEQVMLETIPNATEEMKKKLDSDLVNMANGEVFNDMRNQRTASAIPTVSTPSDSMLGANSKNASNEQSNSKTRVREMKNVPRVLPSNSDYSQQNQTTSDKYRYVSSEESAGGQYNPFDSLRSGGNASASTILIVIASFVIIAMLIIIALTILGEIGMLPLD